MKELFFSALVPILITALFFGLILTYVLWYTIKHPFSGKVVGKAMKRGMFILILKDSEQREAKIITDEATWDEVKFYNQYTKKESDRYYLSG